MQTNISHSSAKWRAWIMAARPRTFAISLGPVVLGTILAKTVVPNIDWILMLYGMLTTLFVQIGMHYINDAIDFKKGADTTERIGPQRATQSGLVTYKEMYFSGWIAFLLAVLFSMPLILKGGVLFLLILFLAIVLGYCYTGGPYPIAYLGLSEPLVILFYGIVSVAAMYYLQTGFVDAKAVLAGLQEGCLATVILAINNMRDIYCDRLVNKKTLAVRFGLSFARFEVGLMALLPFALGIFWWIWGFQAAALLPLLVLPLAFALISGVRSAAPSKLYGKFFAMAGLLHLAFTVLLIIGFLV